MDIKDAIEEYLASKKPSVTVKTYRWYSYHLDRFESWCTAHRLSSLSTLSAPLIQQALDDYTAPSTNSRHGYAQVTKQFLRWCSEDEEYGVKEKTIKRIALPKLEVSEVVLFTDNDISAMLRACTRLPLPHRSIAIIHTFLDTGVRASELCWDSSRPEEETGLLVENIFLGRDDSYIRVMGKGRKGRTVGLGIESTSAMRKYLKRERGESECPYVFLSRNNEPLGVRMVEQLIQDIGELAGVEHCYPHRFRHTFAVNSLLNGVSEFVLMKLMGHTSLESTKIYVRAMTEIQARKNAPSVVDTMRRKEKLWRKT